MPPEKEDELELENEEDEDEDEDEDEEDDDDDDDDPDAVVKEDLLEEIADTLGENMPSMAEVDVDEQAADTIIFTMNDDSRWKLVLRKVV